MVDEPAIQQAVSAIIAALGEDACREGLRETPRRVAEMYREICSGLTEDPLAELTAEFEEDHREMVVLKDITFYSLCEHHFLPFFGVAHIGYIPSEGRVVGIGKLARVVDILARRPQLQERMTRQIADTLVQALQPTGVAVVIQAEHLCLTMRGLKKPGTNVVTSANRGLFRENASTRAEFLALLQGK